MPNEIYVPMAVYTKTIKTILGQLQEFAVSVQVFRVALMNAQTLPLSADYLKGVDASIRETPEFRAMAEAIAKIPTADNPDTIDEILRRFEGPVQ